MDIPPTVPGGDHVTNISVLFRGSTSAYLIVDVRLFFSQIETPAYHVVVGEIDLSNAQHLEIYSRHISAGKFAPAGA